MISALVKCPKSMTEDRVTFDVTESMYKAGFTVECLNAVRRSAFKLSTVGLIVTPNQKAEWINDLSNFHNELIEKQLESIPVHFMSVKLDEETNRLVQDGDIGFTSNSALHAHYKKALEILPGRFEVVLNVVNDTNEDMCVTTQDFKLVDTENEDESNEETKSDEAHLQNVGRLLFPSYNAKGEAVTGQTTSGAYRHLELFVLPKKVFGAPASRVSLRMGFTVVPAEGARIIVTNFGYLPVPNEDELKKVAKEFDDKIKDTMNSVMGQIQEPNEDTLQMKRRRTDFFIADWQQHPSLHKQGQYTIFMKSIPVLSERMALKLMTAHLMNEIQTMLMNDMQTITVEAPGAGESDFLCMMMVSSPTVSGILARRFTDNLFGAERPADGLMVIFCADRKDHPSDQHTIFRVVYRPINDSDVSVAQVRQVFRQNILSVAGKKTASATEPGEKPSLLKSLIYFNNNI